MNGSGLDGVRCMMMRGGTSRALYFVASDLPDTPEQRDCLLSIMGSGHPLQVDGLGGAHPLTSKVAVVSSSQRDDADIDYLFLQLGVEQATITDQQNCGNILAGVGPFAVERGLIDGGPESTTARIRMAALRLPGGIGSELAEFPAAGDAVDLEHPTGHLEAEVELDPSADPPRVLSAGVIRTARKLFDGTVFWETITWSEAERAKGQAWGLKTIASFHTHGPPPIQ